MMIEVGKIASNASQTLNKFYNFNFVIDLRSSKGLNIVILSK